MSYWLDLIGSLIVALYLIRCGVQTIREAVKKQEETARCDCSAPFYYI